MDIQGKIIVALPERSGVSARSGNAWKAQSFVIETHEQYPKRVVFDVFGADRLAAMNIQVGDERKVSFDIDAHEYQGRWYNTLRAFASEVIDPAAAQAQQAAAYQPQPQSAFLAPPPVGAPAPAPSPAPGAQSSVDDLPF